MQLQLVLGLVDEEVCLLAGRNPAQAILKRAADERLCALSNLQRRPAVLRVGFPPLHVLQQLLKIARPVSQLLVATAPLRCD